MTGYNMQRPYAITCPECGGALFPVIAEPAPHFECHIGHKLSPETMLDSQMKRLEVSLSAVMVIMKERAELCRQLQQSGLIESETAIKMVAESDERANEIKKLLEASWLPIPAEL
jgi:two-component system chemotaxis response regulator CheB